jgi:aminopeptidase N
MRPAFARDVDQFVNTTQYRIDLSVSADLATITGTQKVHFTNTETTTLDAVYFRLFANTPSYGGRQTVTRMRVNGVEVTPQMELGDSAMRIEMDPALRPGAAVDFDLDYVTIVPTGTLHSGYDQFGFHDKVLTLPNVYPLIPVHDRQGWHVELAPGYGDAVFSATAFYQVNVTAPAEQVLAATGVCRKSDSAAQRTWRCVSGPMRDFMIAMSADYVIASQQVDDVTINSYALAGDAAVGRQVLGDAAGALTSYQQRIGAYPFTELDVVETPTAAGGIEYPGLVAIGKGMYDPGNVRREFTVAHETAHQWWYSLVGNDQINEPWLDESLTQYTSVLYYRDAHGVAAAQAVMDLVLNQAYQHARDDGDDKRADLPVASYTPGQYGEIVYGKAPLFFDALYQKIGDAKFNAFLMTYFEAHRYGVAHTADLLGAAATQLDRATIDELLKKWITTP